MHSQISGIPTRVVEAARRKSDKLVDLPLSRKDPVTARRFFEPGVQELSALEYEAIINRLLFVLVGAARTLNSAIEAEEAPLSMERPDDGPMEACELMNIIRKAHDRLSAELPDHGASA